jgi:hypothetical protein
MFHYDEEQHQDQYYSRSGRAIFGEGARKLGNMRNLERIHESLRILTENCIAVGEGEQLEIGDTPSPLLEIVWRHC